MRNDFRDRAQSYLGEKLALDNFSITSVEEFSRTGLSRSVVRVDGSFKNKGGQRSQAFILLLGDRASPVPANRIAEYSVLRALSMRSSIKVPQAFCMEETTEPLGCPFIVTSLLPGVTSPKYLLQPKYLPQGKSIARASVEILGALAAIDSDSVDLGPPNSTPRLSEVHIVELERIENVLRETEAVDMPITSAGLRRLRRTIPPPPPRLSIVHGDYRIGNYLFDESQITGIIDWEMVHKGDPLEDLAWTLLPNWEFESRPNLTAGFLERDEVISVWEKSSGLKVDADALEWWLLFSHIKAVGIWNTARHMFFSGTTTDPLTAVVGYLVPKQESYIAGILKALSA